jgi:ketosteroid isomerase-like protein
VIHLERSVLINSPGSSPITRAEAWQGLVLKADNALPFVPQMTYCKVVERETPTRFVRDIEFRGDKMRERVELTPEQQVTFTRLSGPVLGTINNFIDDTAEGLALRFNFALEVTGMAPAQEAEYAKSMEAAYLGAVDATLAAIRKLHDQAPQPPAWVVAYYRDVDAQDMPAFLAHHATDAKVIFGNNPPAIGHDQIGGAIGGLWAAIDGLRHRFIHVWTRDNTAVCEVAVSYFRKDGKTVTVPCVSILEQRGGKVAELRVHMDIAPVFAP